MQQGTRGWRSIGPAWLRTSMPANSGRKAQDTKAAARGRRGGLGLVTALVLVAIVVALVLNIPIETVIKSSFATRVSNQTSETLLRGRWLRPDGGYIIDVRDAQAGGHLEATYFNPRPINVSRAEWHRHSDELHEFVESSRRELSRRDLQPPLSTGHRSVGGQLLSAALAANHSSEFRPPVAASAA